VAFLKVWPAKTLRGRTSAFLPEKTYSRSVVSGFSPDNIGSSAAEIETISVVLEGSSVGALWAAISISVDSTIAFEVPPEEVRFGRGDFNVCWLMKQIRSRGPIQRNLKSSAKCDSACQELAPKSECHRNHPIRQIGK
jgi:hypothetical protein